MATGTWGPDGDAEPLNVRISFRLGTSVCQTGFKLRDSSLTPVNEQDCAEDVQAWVESAFRNIFGPLDLFLGVDVVNMVSGAGGSVSFGNIVGTQSMTPAQTLPSYVMVPLTFKSSLRRRYGQGRMFIPVRNEGFVEADVLTAGGVTGYQSVIDTLTARYLGSGASSDYTLINVHGQIPPKLATPTTPARPAVPPSWYDVQTVRLNSVVSFVRSRKQGVGS